ncbi:LOW QUALITY PROTEIN: titin-like [Thrips palmi]|uniref:LOW QUALITY PROTEIN: titin-like n=1 Tax=Thrips palmi TaxID=161013 RepID=A0A6P9AB01_THRPL|nr:LOW QUALITY PROTEIN: titin-like [Thrips palmi]
MALLWAAALAALMATTAAHAAATTPAPPAPTPLLAVSVNPKKMAALVGERFIGLTMDPMELSEHRKLGPGVVRTQAMAKGLAPAVLRLAGPSSDTLSFTTGSAKSGNGTVTEADLLAVAEWTRAVGWDLVVALNALARDDDDNWDATEARRLLAVADHHGLPVGLQLGYEAGALDLAGVSGWRLGADLSAAHSLLAEFPRYQDALLLGPDVAAALAASRFARDAAHFLQDETRASSPDAIVWQPWADSSEGRDPVSDLDLVREDVNRLLGRAAARRPLWIAESGESTTSRTFSGALEWAQRVQVAARVGADVILRQWQTLGDDHQPTPDYWVSLLYRRLCGRAVLDSKVAGDKSAATVTAQCTAAAAPTDALNARLHGSFTKLSYERGDVTLMAVNPTAKDAKVAIKFSPAAGIRQAIVHEYVLTAPGHDLGSRSALLNDHLLAMDNGGVLPGLTPRVRRADRDVTLEVPAHSVAFFVFPGAQARVCVTAPPSAVEAEATAVPLQLRPTTEDVHVQFHVEGLGAASKSKAKDKLATENAKVVSKDDALKNSHRSEMHSSNGRPLAWATVTDLEQVAEPADATESTPRSKRASPPPHHPARGPATPEDFMERLEKAQAAQAARRKHMLSHAPQHAPQHAMQAQDEVPDDHPSTIPAAHMYRPDDKEDAPPKAAHRLPHKPFKLPSLPKRAPLVPAPPRHGLPKRPAAPAPRFKPLPRTGAVVASLVDPTRGVSAEDASVEVEDDKQDSFPTGEVLAELGESDEDAESSDTSRDDGLDYIEDDEDEEHGPAEAAAPQATRQEVPEPTDQYYFAPGEFVSSPRQQGAAPVATNRAPSDGELGEMDMIVPAMEVAQPSTPSPFEPHLEEFVVMPVPQRENRARVEEDMTRLYQSEADAAQDQQPPADEDQQELNTDVLIELGKKYLREKKMALKQDRGAEEAVAPPAPSAPSGPGEEEEVDPQQKLRRKRQAVTRLSLPSGATGKPRETRLRPPRPPAPPSRTGSGEDARRTRDLLKELEQRASERRERAEKMREQSPSGVRPREQPDRERLSRAREQLEQQRQQRGQQREQPDRERLSRAREQMEQQRQQREQAERDRIAKAREQLQERFPPRRERVKRSDAACEYLDSFGRHDGHDALAHAGHAWHKVVPAALPHYHRTLQRFDGTPAARYKYGHTPQHAHKNVHKNVHREVLKKTNVVRYLPAEEEDAEEQEKEVRRVDESSEEEQRPAGNQLRRRQHQTYRPHDNLGTLWAGSPLSPLQQQWVSTRPVVRKAPQVEETSYEVATPEVAETPADDESATEYAPGELKTTEIFKTERTYETPATESWGVPDAEEDAGYSSGSAGDDAEEASSASYASLEQTTPHHHHGLHHHHHGVATHITKDVYRKASAGQHQEQSEEQSGEQEQPQQDAPQWQTRVEDRQDASAHQPMVPPEAEGDIGPLPEFPFREPHGPKSHVVGFTADDYSPGGWYTFSSGGATTQSRQQSSAAASYSSTPSRKQVTQAKQAPVDRHPIPAAWTRPAAPAAPARSPDAYEPEYAAPVPARPAPQPQPAPAIRTAYSATRVASRPSVQQDSEVEVAAPPSSWQQTIPATHTAYTTIREPSRPSLQQDADIEVVPPRGSWSTASQTHRVEVAPWREAAAVPAETPTVVPARPVERLSAPEYLPRPSRLQASYQPSPRQYQPQLSVAVEEAPEYLPAPQQAPKPSYQPSPRPQYQPQLSVAVEEAPEYLPAPQQAPRPSYAAAAAPRRQSAPQQKPQREVPQALAYLAKFFQPVEPVQPVQQTRPVKKQPARARDPWAQPAAADNLWSQPDQAAPGWGQPAAGPAPWNRPASAADPWVQTDDAWSEPAPGGSLWNQPAQASNSWSQAAQAAPAEQQWGLPAVQQPAPLRRLNVQEASLTSPGDQLLDYNKDILRYSPTWCARPPRPRCSSRRWRRPAWRSGRRRGEGSSPRDSRQPARAAAAPIRAEWELPSHRVRRALPATPAASEHDDGLPRRRLARSLFYGGNKVQHPDDINDLDWSAETERMRKKKQARQRQRDQGQDDRSGIQVLREDGVMSGIMSSLLGKVVGVIGYLGNRLTRLTGGQP